MLACGRPDWPLRRTFQSHKLEKQYCLVNKLWLTVLGYWAFKLSTLFRRQLNKIQTLDNLGVNTCFIRKLACWLEFVSSAFPAMINYYRILDWTADTLDPTVRWADLKLSTGGQARERFWRNVWASNVEACGRKYQAEMESDSEFSGGFDSSVSHLQGLVQLGSVVQDWRRHQVHNQVLKQPAELRFQSADQVLWITMTKRRKTLWGWK